MNRRRSHWQQLPKHVSKVMLSWDLREERRRDPVGLAQRMGFTDEETRLFLLCVADSNRFRADFASAQERWLDVAAAVDPAAAARGLSDEELVRLAMDAGDRAHGLRMAKSGFLARLFRGAARHGMPAPASGPEVDLPILAAGAGALRAELGRRHDERPSIEFVVALEQADELITAIAELQT